MTATDDLVADGAVTDGGKKAVDGQEAVKLPRHVAIIVDGNGRWAKERGLTRLEGHDAGFENLRRLSNYIFDRGIRYLSLYVFSTENFKREKAEVDHLMTLFVTGLKKHTRDFMKRDVRMVFSGRDVPLPSAVIKARDAAVKQTAGNRAGVVNFCLNYGGRAEITDAVKKIATEAVEGRLTATELAEFSEADFARYLYQPIMPDVDLMIRTSGELRLSNFLLWQNSYAEFYFPQTKFPDFHEAEFEEALRQYTRRDRRFGAITPSNPSA